MRKGKMMSKSAVLLTAGLIAACLCGCSQGEPAKPAVESSPIAEAQEAETGTAGATAHTVFGVPEQIELDSGSGEALGTVAVFRASSDECTPENIELWCNQYVRWGLDNWCVVEYTDRPGYGVYASGAIVETGVELASDYSLADDSDAEFYVFDGDDPAEDGTLSLLE